jgi:type I restriction enzyme R subunit
MSMTEEQLENEALGWLQEVGYKYVSGYAIAPDAETPERSNYLQPLLLERLRGAITRLNPTIPLVAREDALKQIMDLGIPAMLSANRHFHGLLVNGVPVQYQKDGETRGDFVRLVNFVDVAANEWLAVNQYTLKGPSIPVVRTSFCSSTVCRWCCWN